MTHNKTVVFISLLMLFLIIPSTAVGQSITQNSNVYWYGQQDVTIDDTDIQPDTKYNLYSDNGDTFESQLKSDKDGKINIDTTDYKPSSFELRGTDLTTPLQFTVAQHELGTNLNESVVLNGEDIKMTIESNRAEFDVNITSEEIDAYEIKNAVDISELRMTVKSDEKLQVEDIETSEEIIIDSSTLPTGVIDLNMSVTDTNATNITTIRTSKNPRGDAEFTRGTYINTIGNNFFVKTDLSSSVDKVEIGIKGNNYNHNFTLEDENRNNSISFYFNTLKAGDKSKPVTAGQGTKILKQGQDSLLISNLLPVGDYNLTVMVDGVVTDTSNIEVQSLGSSDMKYKTISQDVLDINKSDVVNASEDRNISRNDTVAISVEVGGIQNILNDKSAEPDDLDYNTPFSNQHNMYLNITKSGDDELYNLNSDDELIIDEKNATFYMLVESEELLSIDNEEYDESRGDDEIDILQSFESTFTLEKDSPLTDEKIVSESDHELNITESTVIPSTDNKYDGGYVVRNDTINFSTSYAPETTISVKFETNETVNINESDVDQNKTVSVNYDREKFSTGDNMNVTILDTNESYNYRIGETDVIDNIDIPDDLEVGTEVDIELVLKDKYEDEEVDVDWDINGDSESGKSIQHAFSESGEGTVEVEVHNDSYILFERQKINVDVDQGPYDPDLSISQRDDIIFTGVRSVFEPINSYPGDGVEYEWEVDDDVVGDKKGFTYTFDNSGMKNIEVITELDGKTKTASKDVKVYDSYGESVRLYNYFK